MPSFPILSADAHCLEPEDLWTSRLTDPDWIARAPKADRIAPSTKDFQFDGVSFNRSPDYRRYETSGEWDGEFWAASADDSPYENIAYGDVEGRLADMDADGVWAETIHPNVGQVILGTDDDAFALACARIYNDHVAETLLTERTFPNAIIPIGDIDAAVAEIERIAGLGLRGVELPLSSPIGAPYALRRYDRVWAAARAHGLPISMHVGSGQLRPGNLNAIARDQGLPPIDGEADEDEARAYLMADKLATVAAVRAASTMTATAAIGELIAGGVCERFPELHFVIVETMADFLAIMHGLDHALTPGIGTREIARESEVFEMPPVRPHPRWHLPLRPSEYIRRQVHFTFMEDHDALRNRHLIGEGVLMWGNDYPHYEGCWPHSGPAIEHMIARHDLTDAEARAFFGGTLARLYGIPVPT